MERIKLRFLHSVMSYINLSIFTLIAVSLLSLFLSFWATEQADHDVQSANLAGSMRMQTYHIGLALKEDSQNVNSLIEILDKTWKSPEFTRIYAENNDNEALKLAFERGYSNWFDVIHPAIKNEINDLINDQHSLSHNLPHQKDALYPLLENQVQITDKLVIQFERDAAKKIVDLRRFILFSLLVTTIIGSLIF